MFQSLVVYSLLTMTMLYLSYIGRAKESWKYMVYALLVYALIFGMRYGVGVDHMTYKEIYELLAARHDDVATVEKLEPGFRWFTQALALGGVHYSIYFGLIAFVQLWLTFLAFRDKPMLYPYLVFTFMVTCSMWLTYSNGLRQILVVGVWIYAIRLAVERRPWEYCGVLLCAALVHLSAVMLLPIYFLIRYVPTDWVRSVFLQLGLLAVSLLVMNINVVQSLFARIDNLLVLVGYNAYLRAGSADNIENEVSIGIGFVITLVIALLVIISSRKVKDYYKSPLLTMFYNLFFVGLLLKYIFITSNFFSRFNYYFINLTFIIVAATLQYAHRHNRRLYYSLLGLSALSFLAVILKGHENTAEFVFFFQTDLLYLKTHI